MQDDNPTQSLGYDNMNQGRPLYVRSKTGRYKIATDAQVLAAARAVAENLIAGRDLMDKPQTVKAYLRAKLGGLGHEVFAVLFLDNRLKVIRYMEMSHGTLTQTSVYPREVVKAALRLNAAAAIIAHNHPSGTPEASSADIAMTAHLKHALGLVDVRLLDHVIVAQSSTNSLAEKGQV
ncbi:DNA repair protein RadC [Alcaligenaceae bacterium]|nr:DNA repair protein RadC [Alcaligenaceae bacterium]